MTLSEDRPSQAILVAIDVAKLKNDVLIDLPRKRHRQRLVVLNTRTDHDRLINHLGSLGGAIEIGFDATGNYHRPLAWRLLKGGFRLHLISSVALARTREAIHSGWDKNDPKDAQVMLHMLKTGLTQRYYDPLISSCRGTNFMCYRLAVSIPTRAPDIPDEFPDQT